MGRGENDRPHAGIGKHLRVVGAERQAMTGGEFARGMRGDIDCADEAQAVAMALHRGDEAPPPPPQSDDRGRNHPRHSGWMPASRTSRVHFAISRLMNSANSSGAIGAGSSPRPPSLSFTSGFARLAATTSWSRVTTARGVPARATRPAQKRVSKPRNTPPLARISGRAHGGTGE